MVNIWRLKMFSISENCVDEWWWISGWIEDYFAESTETIVNAYIQRGDHNISELNFKPNSFECTLKQHYISYSCYRLGPVLYQWILCRYSAVYAICKNAWEAISRHVWTRSRHWSITLCRSVTFLFHFNHIT